MPEPKFTPGPWMAIPSKIRWHGSRPIFDNGIWHILPASNTERLPICTVDKADDHHEPTREQGEFEAKLIAKSPELYERLESISQAFDHYQRTGYKTRLTILLAGIPNLLAEARGESNG